MKKLLIVTLIAGTFGSVAAAQAQPGRKVHRRPSPVVVGHGHPKHARYAPAHRAPVAAVRPVPQRAYVRGAYDARRDLAQIVDISHGWKRSVARRDRYEQSLADRRLQVWLAKELREDRNDPYRRGNRRFRELSRELDALDWRFSAGRARRYDYRRKADILDELVVMSRVEVQRAEIRASPRACLHVAVR